MGTTFVSQTDLLFAPVFGWFLCVPKYLAGAMTLGELTQASAAFVTVQVAFNWLVDNYQRLSDWRSATNDMFSMVYEPSNRASPNQSPHRSLCDPKEARG
jgi:ABC-type uncharacterized transport system fused permease/ATPase subunit